jgi:tetratricopeptide (TPR) repeat protein
VEGQKKVQELGIQLKKETGSELARVMKSIKYEPPMHLLPHQQFTLALGYFRKQEYEQAAVLLSHLTELKDDPSYQRAEVYLINGISWYELKHFKLAEEYIKQSVSKSDEDTAVYRKSLLWQALTAQALNRSSESQKILTSIVSRFPHSDEAAMVNGRAPASRSDVEPNRALEARHIANAAADEKSHHEAKVEAHLESHSESISEPHAKPAAEHQQEHHGE